MTEVKICGVTTPEDAELAVGLGAWAVGLVFWPGSPRRCDFADAELIGAELKRRAEVCGVFFNQPLDEVVAIADRCGLTMLQLHGGEGTTYCEEVRHRTGAKVMKAVRVRDAASVRGLEAYRAVDFHLLDAYVPGMPGGTGERFEWELARHHRGQVPLVLSGGLTPENVGRLVEQLHPHAVDTASGTESAPGRKDPEKVRRFFDAVAHAAAAA